MNRYRVVVHNSYVKEFVKVTNEIPNADRFVLGRTRIAYAYLINATDEDLLFLQLKIKFISITKE
jgi:hypothetical protein